MPPVISQIVNASPVKTGAAGVVETVLTGFTEVEVAAGLVAAGVVAAGMLSGLSPAVFMAPPNC